MASERPEGAPTWQEYRDWIRDQDLVAAVTLLEVDARGVMRADATRWLSYTPLGSRWNAGDRSRPEPALDWQGWVDDVDLRGRGWSSTQWRLYAVVAGLATNRPLCLVGVLDQMSDWQVPVWRILTAWGIGASHDRIRLAGGRR